MYRWLIPIILLILSLAVIVFILFRKRVALSILNVAALPQEKTNQVKELLLQKRLERMLRERFSFLFGVALSIWRATSRFGRRVVQRVYALEQHYRRVQKGPAAETLNAEAARKIMDEAETLINQGEYFQAEKKYIEIISQQPKDVKAYEALGNLYVLDHKYDQARETFGFALKLKPDDASVHAAVGELETKEGNLSAALDEFAKALKIRPNSPRYLDFFIEAALMINNFSEAKRGLDKLCEVNPENQKIKEFEDRIKESETSKAEL
jgi:tetratricopeptide (TPR) repeat protein